MSNKEKELKPLDEITHLEHLSTLGTGTFGRVSLVRHKKTQEQYALKIMSISEILRLKQTQHVKNEKDILKDIDHPFIVKLIWAHHDDKFLYVLLEHITGGELFSLLRDYGRFDVETTTFYAAEIVSALDYIHSLNVIYRDLKPENILLDGEGHIKITDFGFAKKVMDRTWTLCGTPEYLAPEIILNRGHNKAVDWWALGVLIYEMIIGFPPFYDDDPFHIYEKIIAGKISWPRDIDLTAKDIIKKLLSQDRTRRLGNMRNGSADIKNHKFFQGIDWDLVRQRKLEPPVLERMQDDTEENLDNLNFRDWSNIVNVPSKEHLKIFEDF